MSVEDTVNQEGTTDQQVETPQFSAVEEQAIEMGWRPKEEWQGSPEDFIDAKNFVRNKSLFDKIDHLSKRVKDQDKALNMLKEHHAKVEEATRQQVIVELKKAKRSALDEGDADKVIEIDDEIAKQRALEAFEKSKVKTQPEGLHPEFVSWVETNSWYAQDPSLRQEADTLGIGFQKINEQAGTPKEPKEVLEYVAKQIKKLYPEKFKNPNRSTPTMVEGASTTRQKKADLDDFQLSEEETRVMKTFVRNGIMSAEDYKKELKKVRG